MTHWKAVTRLSVALLVAFVSASPSTPSLAAADLADYKVYSDSPRLLLKPQRLRLLRRERERQSMRWQQFDALVSGGAPMPEPGFALALHSLVTQLKPSCDQALQWARLPSTTDLRQIALVADWCGGAPASGLEPKLELLLNKLKSRSDTTSVRDRAFAALALADSKPDLAAQVLYDLCENWWLKGWAPKLKAGALLPRPDIYPLTEFLHAIRDNFSMDLREAAPAFFKDLPVWHLLSYYPSPFPAPENEYRIPFFTTNTDPDLNVAMLSRAADMAMVAYDANLLENQYLQGWVMQDRFLMRSPYGAVYEFFWANPYQPGLSVQHLPNLYHDKRTGRLFARSSWEEDASYFCFYDGQVQFFEEGKRRLLTLSATAAPVRVGDIALLWTKAPVKLAIEPAEEPQFYFLVGLKPNTRYDIEADDQELAEERTDPGGILAFKFPKSKRPLFVRIRETSAP